MAKRFGSQLPVPAKCKVTDAKVTQADSRQETGISHTAWKKMQKCQRRLLHAAATGAAGTVRKSAKTRGVNLDTSEILGHTALIRASRRGDTAIVKVLLDAGAPVNTPEPYMNMSPFNFACLAGSADVVGILLKHGADPYNIDSMNHYTGLMDACMGGHLSVVRSILDQCDNTSVVDARALSGHDSLMIAITAETTEHSVRAEIAGVLLDHGASLDHHVNGTTAFHLACANGMLELVSRLYHEKGCDSNGRDHDGFTPLMYVAFAEPANALAAVTMLVEECAADPFLLRNECQSLLSMAGNKRLLEVVRYVVEHFRKFN